MFVRGLLTTAATVCLFATMVPAQGAPRPAELPPASFKGQQYVDSRGCVFLRAGIGGQVNWVARLSRDRKPLCGQTPSGRPVAVAAAPVSPAIAPPAAPRVQQPAVSPGPRATGRPMDTVASLQTPPTIRNAQARSGVDNSRYVPAAPVANRVAVAPPPAAARATPGCPAGSPHGKRARLADGRTSLFCSADPNFNLDAAVARVNAERAPAPVAAAPVGRAAAGYACPAEAPVARRYALASGGSTVMCSDAGGALASLSVPLSLGAASFATQEAPLPKGYKRAWTDDRLNPRRGQGTAQGQAAQDRVWTRETPARLVSETDRRVVPHQKTRAMVATINAPRAAIVGQAAKFYSVQVGSFGVPENARATANRLAGMGLPVTVAKGGKLQTVHLGPFASPDAARQALSVAQRAGFGDAFIRQ
ncbi:MAG: SPOR domain-containing protein [Pseudorhodobacter sp.]